MCVLIYFFSVFLLAGANRQKTEFVDLHLHLLLKVTFSSKFKLSKE